MSWYENCDVMMRSLFLFLFLCCVFKSDFIISFVVSLPFVCALFFRLYFFIILSCLFNVLVISQESQVVPAFMLTIDQAHVTRLAQHYQQGVRSAVDEAANESGGEFDVVENSSSFSHEVSGIGGDGFGDGFSAQIMSGDGGFGAQIMSGMDEKASESDQDGFFSRLGSDRREKGVQLEMLI
jgi:hypothetical protein